MDESNVERAEGILQRSRRVDAAALVGSGELSALGNQRPDAGELPSGFRRPTVTECQASLLING